jgi:hypothetical protein
MHAGGFAGVDLFCALSRHISCMYLLHEDEGEGEGEDEGALSSAGVSSCKVRHSLLEEARRMLSMGML